MNKIQLIPSIKLSNGSEIFNGDNMDVLKSLSDNSIDSIVTDPPYHLTSIPKRLMEQYSDHNNKTDRVLQGASKGFLGKKWDGGDIAFRTEIWNECKRVLKPGGYLLAFSHSRTYHRMATAIENAGFEIRDQIMWIYGSGFPKSHNVALSIDKKLGCPDRGHRIATASKFHPDGTIEPSGTVLPQYESKTSESKEWVGWGTALKPAHEPIVMARKPLSEKTVAENVMKWRTGAINIDDCRINSGNLPKPAHRTFDTNQGEVFQLGENKYEPSELGRYPSNLILGDDGNEEWRTYFYCPKASKKDRDSGLDDMIQNQFSGGSIDSINTPLHNGKNLRKNIHPTVKPVELMQYLVRLVTPKNGICADVFFGSGSTGKACVREGFKFIGIEKEEEYFQISVSRCLFEINKCNPIAA